MGLKKVACPHAECGWTFETAVGLYIHDARCPRCKRVFALHTPAAGASFPARTNAKENTQLRKSPLADTSTRHEVHGDLVQELGALHDTPDQVDIDNCQEVRDANILASSSSRRPEAIARFTDLVKRYPTSGNICALYAQALLFDHREADAITLVQERFQTVNQKSEVAYAGFNIEMQRGRFCEAAAWLLRGAIAIGASRLKGHSYVQDLSSIFEVTGIAHHDEKCLQIARSLDQLADPAKGRISGEGMKELLELARTSDRSVVSILLAAAEGLGWLTGCSSDGRHAPQYTCPECDGKFDADDEGCAFAGECPLCGEWIVADHPIGSTVPIQYTCPECDGKFDADDEGCDFAGECPLCGEWIVVDHPRTFNRNGKQTKTDIRQSVERKASKRPSENKEEHEFPSSKCDLCGRQVAKPSGGVMVLKEVSSEFLQGFFESRRYVCPGCRVTICLPCLAPGTKCPKCGVEAEYA